MAMDASEAQKYLTTIESMYVYSASMKDIVDKIASKVHGNADNVTKAKYAHVYYRFLSEGQFIPYYDDENSYAKLIQYLKDSSKFPRNTYVCAVDDINKTFENMGDYYEQLLEKQEREEGLCLTTVGDIMDEYTNGL